MTYWIFKVVSSQSEGVTEKEFKVLSRDPVMGGLFTDYDSLPIVKYKTENLYALRGVEVAMRRLSKKLPNLRIETEFCFGEYIYEGKTCEHWVSEKGEMFKYHGKVRIEYREAES